MNNNFINTTMIIEKPWGSESWLIKNENYVMKMIYMKKGNKCSLQYHVKKMETIYVISGTMKYHYGIDKDNLKSIKVMPGECIHVPPNTIHRMEAIEEDIKYLEVSTIETDDLVRVEDDYNRVEK